MIQNVTAYPPCLCFFAGYVSVKSHLVDITNLLKTTKGACEALTQHYIQNGWLDHTQTPTENEMVQQALQRMKLDSSQYDEFLKMLCAIKGLDLIIKDLPRSQSRFNFNDNA